MINRVSFGDQINVKSKKAGKNTLSFKNANQSMLTYSNMRRPSYSQPASYQQPAQPNQEKNFWQKASSVIGNEKPFEELLLIGVVALGVVKRKSIISAFRGAASKEEKNVVNSLDKESKDTIDALKYEFKQLKDRAFEAQHNAQSAANKASEAKRIAQEGGGNIIHTDRVVEEKRILPFKSTEIVVNNHTLTLADVINPVNGKARPKMEEALQAMSAKHILGRSFEQKLAKGENLSFVRIPTSEIRPFTNEGGLSAVPREMIENVLAVINKNDNVKLMLDTPLYTGKLSKGHYKLAESDGKFMYQIKGKDKNGKPTLTETSLKLIDSFETPIITDTERTVEKVRLFLGNVENELEYKLAEKFFDVPLLNRINGALKKGKKYETEALRVELLDNGERKLTVKSETVFWDNRKFELNIPEGEAATLYSNKPISTGEPERFAYFNKYMFEHNIKLHKHGEGTLNATTHVVEKHKARDIFNAFDNILSAESSDKEKKGAIIKLITSKLDATNDSIIETRRAVGKIIKPKDAFAKENLSATKEKFYDLIKNGVTKPILGTDMILGNDWHTGFLSAMMRQLATVKGYYSHIEKDAAKKLVDTPIATLMHNVNESGIVYNSRDKIFNIMYGEHAAEILRNSYAINLNVGKNKGLDFKLWNAQMTDSCLNPQAMATHYSDMLIPVSGPGHYDKEISTIPELGKDLMPVFAVRSRVGKYAGKDGEELLQSIAKANNLSFDDVSKNPTLIGITNGIDRLRNLFTAKKAHAIEKHLGITEGKLKAYPGDGKTAEEYYQWATHNKKVILEDVLKRDIDLARGSKGENNPMNLLKVDGTDLAGVTENTPIVGAAGRISKQKGIDIYAESIKEFYLKHYQKGDDMPVFYLQGKTTTNEQDKLLDNYLKVKDDLRTQLVEKLGEEDANIAANRIICAKLFAESGRYDAVKLFSDLSAMSSWFEPCGLVHKEMTNYAAVISGILPAGGMHYGLEHKVNALIAGAYSPTDLKVNVESFAKMLKEFTDLKKDAPKFKEVLKNAVEADFSWMSDGGAAQQYADVLRRFGILKS